MREIELGKEVKDKVTGWSGIAIAYTVTLGGCESWNVQKKELDSDGNTDEQWFNAARLEVVGDGISLDGAVKMRRPIGFGKQVG
jgi:hypothetical protein